MNHGSQLKEHVANTNTAGRTLAVVSKALILLLLSGTAFAQGTLSGTVVDAANGETPVYPVIVDLIDPVSGEDLPGLGGFNNPDGTYEITGIPAGNYKVIFNAVNEANGYVDELHSNIPCDNGGCGMDVLGDIVAIADGPNTLDAELDRAFLLSGSVTNTSGQPISYLTIEVFDEGGNLRCCNGTSEEDGTWSLAVTGAGNYYARIFNVGALGYIPEIWNNIPCDGCDPVSTGTPIEVSDSDVPGIDFELASQFGPNPFDGMSAIDIEVDAVMTGANTDFLLPPGSCVGSVDEATSINFLRFEFVELRGRPGHQGDFPISGQPLTGETSTLAELWGNWTIAEFRMLNEAGDLITEFEMDPTTGEAGSVYLQGILDVPNVPFRIAVSGVDDEDTPYNITCSYLFQSETVEVNFLQKDIVSGPGPVNLHALVTNHGASDTFDISVSNNLGLPMISSPSQLSIAGEESGQVNLAVDIPKISSGVLITTVRLDVKSSGNTDNENHGEATVRIERFSFILGDGFEEVGITEVPE